MFIVRRFSFPAVLAVAGGDTLSCLPVMKVYIDGQYFDEADAKISVFDHGLLYGDGVFEGIRMYHNRIFKLSEHLERLFYSAKAILLDIPLTVEELAQACVETCRANGLRDGYIRLIVTRGRGTWVLTHADAPSRA